MEDLTRTHVPNNQLVSSSEEATPIVLKFKDEYADTWERNTDNTIKFDQVKRILLTKERICFFQKKK